MPRLDAERVALWRRLDLLVSDLRRLLDTGLTDDHGVPLVWFEVLSALRAAGGAMRIGALAESLGDVLSSLSRRLDRMEENGLLTRAATPGVDDRRAVTVTLTPNGRAAWRDANVTFRRVVQQRFAARLTETDIVALQRILSKTGH